MATDYTIAAQVKPPQADPLALITKFQGAQTGMLNNRLLGQQVQGKEALGRIIGAHTNAEGETDYGGASAEAAQDPNAALLLPQFQSDALDRHIKQNTLSSADLELSHKKLSQVGDLAYSLLGNSDKIPLTPENITSAVKTNLFDTGVLTKQDLPMASSFISRLGPDPNANAAILKQLYTQFHPDSAGMSALRGNIQTTDTGPANVITRTSPLPGEGTEGLGAIGKGLAPSIENTPAYNYVDPKTGQSHIVTQKEAAATAPGQTPQGITSGMPIGSAETAASNVQQAQSLQGRAAIVPQRRAALSNLANTLDNFKPGPKADLTYGLSALATQFGLAPPSAAKGVAAQEEFNKLSAQIALDQWGALGGTGSNEQLASTMKANPHQAMSQMGIKNVVALLQGNEDAIGSQFDAWKKYSAVHGPSSYGDFLQGWNKYYDPRVFQAAHMAAPDVKAMKAKMTPDELKTFTRDQNIAQQAGWLGK